jgi:hypothetical protein
MPVYLVSYDLVRPADEYAGLWEALHCLEGERVLASQWIVRATGDAGALCSALRPFLADVDDRLLVMDRDGGDWASWNLRTSPQLF